MTRNGPLCALRALVASAFLYPGGLWAQFPCPPRGAQPVDSARWLSCHVDREPVLTGELAEPRYPSVLVAAGLGGSVSYRVMVDSTGSAEPSTFTPVKASHPAFEGGVRDAVAQWHWEPATDRGHAVEWWFRGVVDFLVPPPELAGLGVPPAEILARRTDRDSGTVIVVGWPPRDTGVGKPAAEAVRDVRILALRELVATLVGAYTGKDVPIACISFRDRPDGPGASRALAPDADALAAVSQPGVAVVVPARCPPTFASMARVEGRVIPPGGDPYQVWVGSPEPWVKGVFLVDGGTARGPAGTNFRCWADVRRALPVVKCWVAGYWVS